MAAQKMKSNRSAAKRFKLKPNGKLKRIKGSKHHCNVHKAQSRIRRLKEAGTVDGKKAANLRKVVFAYVTQMRVKTSVASKRRKKRLLKQTKGFWGQRKNVYRRAKETLLRSLAFSYRDRKAKKRTMRSLWISRINAALREEGLTYSKFIHSLKVKEIDLDRRVLAELAINHPDKFKQLIQSIN